MIYQNDPIDREYLTIGINEPCELTTEEPCELTINQLCELTQLDACTVIEIVDHNIVDPKGTSPQNWRFSTTMVATTKKALRLQEDLDINWSGIAFAISLLEELKEIRERNQLLTKRVNIFHA